jgi:hypothetical protein
MIISDVRMDRRIRGLLGLVAAAGLMAAGCAEDPLASLDGSAAGISVSRAFLDMSQGDEELLIASVVDGRSMPLAIPVEFTACDAAVGVELDTTYHPVPPTTTRATVTAVSPAPTCVQMSGGGVTDTVDVTILPTVFAGAISDLAPAGGEEITITSTALLKFAPASVTVTFGGGKEGLITSATADQIKVLVPFSSPGPLTITGIDVTFVPGLVVTLTSNETVTQTGDAWTGDLAFATAPEVALPAAAGANTYLLTNFGGPNAAGTCAEIVFAFGSTGPCVIYKLVVPAGGLNLTISTDWDSGADIDIYACDDTGLNGCFEDGGGGATGAQPQAFTYTFAAGTHYLVIENYDGVETPNLFTTITRN